MYKVHVRTSKNYDVIIDNNIIQKAGELIKKQFGGDFKVFIICDDNTEFYCLKSLKESLDNNKIQYKIYVLNPGEISKNINSVQNILTELLNYNFQRSDILISLGGGVVGDITGFTASIFKRGIKFINIPTTLLSMVDASVGGKTGINFNGEKNSVGTFYQPELVICDPLLLDTLPENILRQGYAEIVKYGILCDAELFLKCKTMPIDELIYRCIEIKNNYVSDDEYDNGKRMFLNLGHTFAHGLENLTDYTISHGDAVAIGLILAVEYSAHLGYTTEETVNQIKDKLTEFGFDTVSPFPKEKILLAAKNDKKSLNNYLNLILIQDIGKCLKKEICISEL